MDPLDDLSELNDTSNDSVSVTSKSSYSEKIGAIKTGPVSKNFDILKSRSKESSMKPSARGTSR